MSTLELVLLSTACSFLATGFVVLPNARKYLRPDDHRPVSRRTIYYQPDRFTPEGRRFLIRAWGVILVGVALAIAWVVV